MLVKLRGRTGTRIRLSACSFAATCLLTLIVARPGAASDDAVFESTQAPQDFTLTSDPTAALWSHAHPVYADKGPHGELRSRYRTEILSRWTEKNLYFLFICPYEALYLKPQPSTSTETFQLWDWDVAEVFIGADFQNIRRYKEFEISPQGEWVDLDIDLAKPHHEDGWTWNSGFTVAARIDRAAKIWYGAMKIPFSALTGETPQAGQEFRINLFRSQGPPPHRIAIAWRPTMSNTFHTPERFGLLRLTKGTVKYTADFGLGRARSKWSMPPEKSTSQLSNICFGWTNERERYITKAFSSSLFGGSGRPEPFATRSSEHAATEQSR